MQVHSIAIPAYGEIYVDENAVATSVNAQDTFVQITVFDTNGESRNTTPDHTGDDITIIIPGRYNVVCTISAFSSQSNEYHFAVFKSGSQLMNLSQTRSTTVAGKVGTTALMGIVNMVANDTVDVRVERRDGGAVARSITAFHITLGVHRMSV